MLGTCQQGAGPVRDLVRCAVVASARGLASAPRDAQQIGSV